MIAVTNDTKDFIENQNEELFIFGAGNSGYWIGHYLNKCGIEFSGYIDSNEKYCGALCQGKTIYQPQKLGEYRGKKLRLIISPRLFEPILSNLLFIEQKYGFHALCLVPRYKHPILNKEMYDINFLLGYFRRHLYTKNTPTIISNDCVAGHIYHFMNMIMLSPTINIGIDPDDFLKLCKEPEKYFAIEVEELFYNVCPLGKEPVEGRMRLPAMKIDDITVTFAHTNGKTRELVERWNIMRKKINWENIIYVFRISDGHVPVSKDFMQSFLKLEGKHLIINCVTERAICQDRKQLNLPEYAFDAARAIENSFDLLGWLNQKEG